MNMMSRKKMNFPTYFLILQILNTDDNEIGDKSRRFVKSENLRQIM